MRKDGSMHPTDGIRVPADTVNTILLGASAAQSMDWPTGTAIARLTGYTTAGQNFNFQVNLYSTAVVTPTTGSSVSSGAGVSHTVATQDEFQIPGNSTGFSVIALTSGYVQVECWSK